MVGGEQRLQGRRSAADDDGRHIFGIDAARSKQSAGYEMLAAVARGDPETGALELCNRFDFRFADQPEERAVPRHRQTFYR